MADLCKCGRKNLGYHSYCDRCYSAYMISRRKISRAEYLHSISVDSAKKADLLEYERRLADIARIEEQCLQLAATGAQGLKSAIAGMMYLTDQL